MLLASGSGDARSILSASATGSLQLSGPTAVRSIAIASAALSGSVQGFTTVNAFVVLRTTGQLLASIAFTSVANAFVPRVLDIELIAVRLRELGVEVQASEIEVVTSLRPQAVELSQADGPELALAPRGVGVDF